MIDLSGVKAVYNEMIEAVLAKTGLTIPCTLAYDISKLTACPNCIYDTISKKSSNQYKSGGPLPFANGQTCPYCLGAGTSNTQTAEHAVDFIVLTDSRNFIDAVNVPDIAAQTICSINYLDQIKKCSKIIFNTDIPNLTNNIFIRANEPTAVGLGDSKYIFTSWKR